MDYVNKRMPLARYKPAITCKTPIRGISFSVDGLELDLKFMLQKDREVTLSLSRKEAAELMKDIDTFLCETEETFSLRNEEGW